MRVSQRFGSKPQQQQVRGHLAQRIADEEKPRAKAVDRRAEMQIPIHLQRGKADVDAVHVGQPIAHADHRKQPQARLPQRRLANPLNRNSSSAGPAVVAYTSCAESPVIGAYLVRNSIFSKKNRGIMKDQP